MTIKREVTNITQWNVKDKEHDCTFKYILIARVWCFISMFKITSMHEKLHHFVM